MKMESAKLCGLLAAVFLFLTLLIHPPSAGACTCFHEDAKSTYCEKHTSLIKARILGVEENLRENWYKIEVTKVLKGPQLLQDYKIFKTRQSPEACEYRPLKPFNDDEDLLEVWKSPSGDLYVNSCGFNKKWDSLSDEEKKGFEGGFKEACP